MTLSDAGDGSEWVEADEDDQKPQTFAPELDDSEDEPFDPASENEEAEDELADDQGDGEPATILPAQHEDDEAADRPADRQD